MQHLSIYQHSARRLAVVADADPDDKIVLWPKMHLPHGISRIFAAQHQIHADMRPGDPVPHLEATVIKMPSSVWKPNLPHSIIQIGQVDDDQTITIDLVRIVDTVDQYLTGDALNAGSQRHHTILHHCPSLGFVFINELSGGSCITVTPDATDGTAIPHLKAIHHASLPLNPGQKVSLIGHDHPAVPQEWPDCELLQHTRSSPIIAEIEAGVLTVHTPHLNDAAALYLGINPAPPSE